MSTRRAGRAAVLLVPVIALGACTSAAQGGGGGGAGNATAPVARSESATATGPNHSVIPRPNGASGSASTRAGRQLAGRGTSPSAPYPTTARDVGLNNQASVLDALPGNASSTCAVVGTRRDVRAGGIAAGNFADAQRSFAKQYRKTEVPELNLYVIPERAAGNHKLQVTIDPTGPGAPTKVTSTQVEHAGAARYFAVDLPIEQPGTYRLTMKSAGGSGCFDVSFTA